MLQRLFTHQIVSTPLHSMVTCSGWLATVRDHGGIVFFQLRDRFGHVQCVFDPAEFQEIHVNDLKPETVVSVQGILIERPEGTQHPADPLGHLELHLKKVTIHSKATALPFQIMESHKITNEELRLQYRYLDLRHPERAHPFFIRSEVNHLMREFLRKHDFVECETPIMTKPTPEGARAYIVPSRIHLHNFYALAQSPQLFKQLMMASGFERYYQIARCFRDEDLRADRQPEFTQLDIEMSFIDERMIQELIEQLVRHLFTTVLNVQLPAFKRMTYAEAMKKYGCDKPDLRCPLFFVDVKEILKPAQIGVFQASLNHPQHIAIAMRLPQGAQKLSRKDLDQLTDFVKSRGAAGLAYLKLEDGVLSGPIAKIIPEQTQQELIHHTEMQSGDVVFLAVGPEDKTYTYFSALRDQLRDRLDLIDMPWAPLWVVDFPMFEYDEEAKRYQAKHHPFTAPKHLECEDILQWVSRGYDFVLNGYEVGGGSIRIHEEDLQARIFEIIGLSEEQAQAKFGFLLEAFRYGFPPHGGIALGIDRLIMLMTGTKNVRDVILFPKTQSGYCPLTSAPNVVSPDQLKELALELAKLPPSKSS